MTAALCGGVAGIVAAGLESVLSSAIMKGRDSIPFEAEITSELISGNLDGTRFAFEWRHIDEIIEESCGIFFISDRGIVGIHERGFKSSEHREEFVSLACKYHEAATRADQSTVTSGA
jgi:hypothetical protein